MLRWRLLIGLVSIFVLLLAVAGYSISLISRLQSDITSILEDNYESIREAHGVRVQLLRLNAEYIRPTLAETLGVGLEPLESRHAPTMEKTITALRLLARSDADRKQVARLQKQLEDYLEFLRGILTLPSDGQAQYDERRRQLIEMNLTIAGTTEAILASNEAAMMEAQRQARVVAQDTIYFLVGAMVVATIVLAYTYFLLGRSLVTPIEELTRSVDAVRSGEFESEVPVRSDDELSQLAIAFNAMAGELREYRRDTDETIVRLNRSLRETIAAFPYPVLLLDSDLDVWVTNDAASDFLRGIESPDRLPEPIQRHIESVRRTREDYLPEEPRESLLFRVNEREVHYLPRILRIFSPEGEFSGVAVILIDVSRFRWLDDMKSNLISTISHEIKTPLTGIRMMLHLLLEKSAGGLTDMQDEMVQAACDDCERLLRTLNSLLDLSRMEAGRTQLEIAPASAEDLLEDCRTVFRNEADLRGIELIVDAEPNLPRVLMDRQRMMHVIGNFLSNALRFAPPGSTVRLTADKAGADFVRLSVIDAGPGVEEEYHARIFDKFFRPPNRRGDGAGLGLSIARQIVDAHDGRIGVHSEPHVATRFYCELPIA